MRKFPEKRILITVILFLLFLLFVVWIIPAFDVSSYVDNVFCLDVLSNYSRDTVYELFNYLGQTGLQQYKTFIYIDFAYIIVYGGMSVLLINTLIFKIGKLGNYIKIVAYIPFILILSDITENINTLILINQFPYLNNNLITFASNVSGFKWIAASIVAGTIISISFYAILRFIFWKLNTAKND